jgi:hypothetical protein
MTDPSSRNHLHTLSPAIPIAGEAAGATRRDALRLLGGGVALAGLVTAGRINSALAQEASPVPPEESKVGLFVTLRTRTVEADMSADELTAALGDTLVPVIRDIPGFVEYYVVQNDDTRDRTAVNIFANKAGADESTKQASEIIESQGLADYYEDAEPTVMEGVIVTAAQ